MRYFIALLALSALSGAITFAESRGIAIEVSQALNKRVLVTIKSAEAKENKTDVTVDEASQILSESRGWGSKVFVSIRTDQVHLSQYRPLIDAIAANGNLELSSINRTQESKTNVTETSPYLPANAERNPSDPLSEQALLEAAKSDPRARHFLADLWRREQLSTAARELIVKRHLHFKLREEFPHDPETFPTLRSLTVFAETDFPFPENAWIEYSGEISVEGGSPPTLGPEDFGSSRSLFRTNGRSFWNLGSSYQGSPLAKGVIQLREVIRNDGRSENVWTMRVETNQIRLEHRTAAEASEE